MPQPESYHALQARFASALNDRETVADTAPQFVGDAQRVAHRIALYRGNVLVGRTKALQAAYPVVAKIVGEEFFAGLARAYMQAHPSTSGDLNGYGDALAEFITASGAATELPYLADVAKLEWLVHRAHYAADGEPIALSQIAALPAEHQGEVRLALQSACALLQSDYPLARIWTVHRDDYTGNFDVAFDEGPYYALVQRPHWRVEVRDIDLGAYAFLHALMQGKALGGAVEAALTSQPQFDLSAALLSALDDRLIVDCRIEGDKI